MDQDEAWLLEVQTLHAQGATLEEILQHLRSRGAFQLPCIQVVKQLYGTDLKEAKRLVHLSQAFSDLRADADAFHEAVHETMTKIAEKRLWTVQTRPMTPADRAFVVSLASRLVGFGLPLERDAEAVAAQMRRELERLPENVPDVLELVAEDENGTPLGFVQAGREWDDFSKVPRAYVHMLAVTEEAEGHGVAGLLLEEVQAWSRAKGFSGLALHVFATNARARAFYARLGFVEDSVRLVKL